MVSHWASSWANAFVHLDAVVMLQVSAFHCFVSIGEIFVVLSSHPGLYFANPMARRAAEGNQVRAV